MLAAMCKLVTGTDSLHVWGPCPKLDDRQQTLTPLCGAGDQQNILLRTSVGVQTQHAHHELEAEGSDAATQHREQPVADAAPSPACPRADGQVRSNCLRDHQIVVMPACIARAAPCTYLTWVPAVTACPSVQQDQSQGTADFVLSRDSSAPTGWPCSRWHQSRHPCQAAQQ